MKQLFYAKQNIIRGKNSTFVKIVSLTLGLFISIILFARVAFELNYDTFYQDVDRVYIIKTAWNDEKTVWVTLDHILFTQRQELYSIVFRNK